MGHGLWPWLCGAAVFAAYAAPVVLTGSATFLGYTLLGDTSIHFTLIDWVMKHGFHAAPNLPPSSTHAALAAYLDTAYPLGAHTALGAVRPLVGQDVAWVFQPYLALLGVFTSLSIYAIVERAIEQRWLVALTAFLAAQPGLVYAYFLEGSVKEMATIALIPLLVAVGAEYVARRDSLRAVIPLAVTTGAAIAVLNVSILPWLGPILLAVLIGALYLRGPHRTAGDAVGFAVLAALLTIPSLWVVSKFVHSANSTFSSSGSDLGNLFHPLKAWQAFGIWPTGDFRQLLMDHKTLVYVLIAVEIAAVLIGLVWTVRRRNAWPLVFVGISLVGWAYVTARSNTWGDAKALMIVSPAILVAAMLGVAALWQRQRAVGLVVAGLITLGVLWTNALAYHGADVAPRARLAELGKIGDRFAGQGPALYTEFEEFSKHFLRGADPTGTNESWQDKPHATYANGAGTAFGFSSDVDQLAQPYLQRFRILVLRRSGSAPRPPSNYKLVFQGHYYEVWQRTKAPTVLAHLALGTRVQPGDVPPCSQLRDLSRRGGTRLAYVERPLLPELDAVKAQRPGIWRTDVADQNVLVVHGAGTLSGPITVTQPSRYTVWVQGTFSRGFVVRVDGRRVGVVKNELNPRGQYVAAGTIALTPGQHTLTLTHAAHSLSGLLRAGDGGDTRLLGPTVLDPATDTRVVRQLPSSRWHDLCGKRLDWAEAIR